MKVKNMTEGVIIWRQRLRKEREGEKKKETRETVKTQEGIVILYGVWDRRALRLLTGRSLASGTSLNDNHQ